MMEKNKSIPKIRFEGFTDLWEKKQFSKTFLFLNNNTLSRAELNYESGSTKNIHYGDVLIKFGECLDVLKEDLPYITNEKDVNKYAHLQNGDIIIADAAEDETVGKCTELLNVQNEHIVAGLHTIACRPLFSFASGYLGYFINAPIYHDQLLPLMQGTKISGISKTAINGTDVYYPESLKEQTQISNYFQNIDKLIEAKHSRINKLKNIKKACLEKMFPKEGATVPEIRFKGFNGEWEEKKLGDTDTYYADGNYGAAYPSSSDMSDENDGIPFLRGSNLQNGRINKKDVNFITYEKHQVLLSGHLLEDDVVIAVRGTLGALGLAGKENVNWNINSQLAIIRTNKNEIKGSYLIQHLLSDEGQRKIVSKISGSALKQLPIGQLKDILIPITETEEQTHLSIFFKNLDNLIAKNEYQLTKLKNIKKACLEKMFVNKEDAI